MRKYLRSIARAKMQRAGIQKANKKRYYIKNGIVCHVPSFFAMNWRNWV